MIKKAGGTGELKEIQLGGRMHPLACVLAALPAVIGVFVLILFALEPVPLPLIGLLVLVMGCAGALGYVALEIVTGTTLKIEPGGLQVRRLFGSETYAWADIADIKVIPATGTFGDDPFQETGNRIGLGLFLRKGDSKPNGNSEADIILATAEKEDASRLVTVVDKLQRNLKLGMQPKRPVSVAPKRLRQAHQRDQFRRRPATTKSTRDVVGQFRGA